MTGDEIRNARRALGLTQSGLAARLKLAPAYGKDRIRAWEAGRAEISGPAQVAIELMVKELLAERRLMREWGIDAPPL